MKVELIYIETPGKYPEITDYITVEWVVDDDAVNRNKVGGFQVKGRLKMVEAETQNGGAHESRHPLCGRVKVESETISEEGGKLVKHKN